MNSQTVTLEVEQIAALSRQVLRVGLRAADDRLPRYEAGQYLKLVMPDGSLRALSIASAPESEGIELQVQQRAGAGTGAVVEHLRRSATVDCHMPYGSCRLPGDQRPVVMIAGGTGIAPMRAMLTSSIARAETRAIWIYWGVATAEALFLHEELQALATQHPRVRYRPVVEHPDAGWRGAIGLPHERALTEHPAIAQMTIFCHGSPAMGRAVFHALHAHGVPADQFHCDWLDILRARNEPI